MAAALVAAVISIAALACGDDDGESPPTATPTPAASPAASVTPTPTDGATPTGSPGAVSNLGDTQALFTLVGAQAEDLLASATNLAAGDFDGDGVADVIVGAPQADGPDDSRAGAGEAYVLFGPLEGTLDLAEDDPDLTIFGALPNDNLGFSVLASDINADGIDDVIIGAPGVSAGWDLRTDQGRVYVFFGNEDLKGERDLADDVFDFTVTGAEGFSHVGTAMAGGDINGDGLGDLVLGAPFAGREPGTPPGSQRTQVGEAYVIFGSEDVSGEVSIPSLQQDVTFSGNQKDGQFGIAVAAADIDGDGRDDVIVGAHRTDLEEGDTSAVGAAYVFLGDDDLPTRLTIEDGDQALTILGPAANSAFGFPIAAGDFNGDGAGDFAIAAQTDSPDDRSTAGAIYVFMGDSNLGGTIDLSKSAPAVRILGARSGEITPSSLAAGDVDDDGVDDLILGSVLSRAADGPAASGRVFLILGRSDLPASIDLAEGSQDLTIVGAQASDYLGGAIAIADASGDGLVDLLLLAGGADGRDDERPDAGEVYLIPAILP
jgi:hypothetical protein